AKAFKNATNLKRVYVGKNVVKIKTKAFYNNKVIIKIVFKGNKLSKVGVKAFGSKKKAKVYIPKKVFTRYKKLIIKRGGKRFRYYIK
nr:leucine-rich repeat domain-containing protein [Lachnospiraceae bacterium]